MTKKKHAARQALMAAADKLAIEMWEGKWEHLKDRPIVCEEIVSELQRRCPGLTKTEYEDSIARCWWNQR